MPIMNKLFGLSLVAVFAVLMAACSDPAANVTAANVSEAKEVKKEEGKELKFSNENSKIDFRSNKAVSGGHDGGFNQFTGTVTVDGDKVKQVEVNIDMNGIWTDDDKSEKPKLTNHLKSGDFFDVEKFPTAKFVTTEIKEGGEGGTHTVTGNLTLKETTKSVTFPATVAYKDGKVTTKAEFKINRMDWKVEYKGAQDNLILNDVILKLEINAG
jgi:polyisoprenoid-binding protein YceI